MNGGWLGVFIAPTTKVTVGEGFCRMAQSGAPATSPGRWVLTVGASDRWATGQSGAPSGAALTSARAGTHCSLLLFRCKRPLALCSRYSAGTPDNPVNYSGATPRIPECGKFGVGFPGAPDSPVRQTRAAFGCFLLSLFEPFSWSFYWFVVTFGTCKTYNIEQTS
jgi:hypothetical protein